MGAKKLQSRDDMFARFSATKKGSPPRSAQSKTAGGTQTAAPRANPKGASPPAQTATLPTVGSTLPLPSVLAGLEGIPGSFATLAELSSGGDMLVLVATTESAMTDPLRQTLVGVSESMPPGVGAAAVSLVGVSAYRKLARKADVAYPLLSDPGREWLGPLGCAPTGEIVAFLVSTRSGVVLQVHSGIKPQLMVERIASAAAQGLTAVEEAAASSMATARAAEEASALAAQNERLERERAEAEVRAAAEAKAEAKREEQRRLQAEVDAANARLAATLEAAEEAKAKAAREKEAKRAMIPAKAKAGKGAAKEAKLKAAQA